ncbi:MAG: asparaginase domain-containing protein [Pseudomonadota bacterium]
MKALSDPTLLRLIYAGGTIGADGAPLAPLPGPVFRARFDRLADPALAGRGTSLPPLDWSCLEPAIDSTDATPRDWLRLARAVLDPPTPGPRIVLHGTDTLANTAAALSLMLCLRDEGRRTARWPGRVIVTGSMLPLFRGDELRPGSDALDNLTTAFDAAATAPPGVHVTFGGHCLRGDHVLKLDSRAMAAFGSPSPAPMEAGDLAAADATALLAALDRLEPHLGRRAVPVVYPAPEAPDHQAGLIQALVDGLGDRLGALILAGYGQGNIPAATALVPVLEAVTTRGIPVLLTTQVIAGGVAPEAYAAGAWLADCGVIPGGLRTIPNLHAVAHLGLAIAAAEGWPPAVLDAFLRSEIGVASIVSS